LDLKINLLINMENLQNNTTYIISTKINIFFVIHFISLYITFKLI